MWFRPRADCLAPHEERSDRQDLNWIHAHCLISILKGCQEPFRAALDAAAREECAGASYSQWSTEQQWLHALRRAQSLCRHSLRRPILVRC